MDWFALVMLIGGIALGAVYRNIWDTIRRRRCVPHHPDAICNRCGTVTERPDPPVKGTI